MLLRLADIKSQLKEFLASDAKTINVTIAHRLHNLINVNIFEDEKLVSTVNAGSTLDVHDLIDEMWADETVDISVNLSGVVTIVVLFSDIPVRMTITSTALTIDSIYETMMLEFRQGDRTFITVEKVQNVTRKPSSTNVAHSSDDASHLHESTQAVKPIATAPSKPQPNIVQINSAGMSATPPLSIDAFVEDALNNTYTTAPNEVKTDEEIASEKKAQISKSMDDSIELLKQKMVELAASDTAEVIEIPDTVSEPESVIADKSTEEDLDFE